MIVDSFAGYHCPLVVDVKHYTKPKGSLSCQNCFPLTDFNGIRFTGEPGDRTSEMETLCLSAQTSSITVKKRPQRQTGSLFNAPQAFSLWVYALIYQTTWTAWEAAWRTEVCSVWRTAVCSWSAALSLRERSSTGSCRGPTMTASKRSVSTDTHACVLICAGNAWNVYIMC